MGRDRRVWMGVAVTIIGATVLGGCADPDYMRMKAFDQYQAHNYEASRRVFEKTVALQPGDAKSHYYLGLIALNQDNDPATARRHLELAYTIVRSWPRTMLTKDFTTTNEYVPVPSLEQVADALAEAIYREGNPNQLAGFLREMTNNPGKTADFLRLGKYMRKIGDPDSARAAYLTAMKLADPTDARPYTAMADFYDQIGDKEQALRYLRQAYWVNPRDPAISAAIRDHGAVPGPTYALPPEGLVGRPGFGHPSSPNTGPQPELPPAAAPSATK